MSSKTDERINLGLPIHSFYLLNKEYSKLSKQADLQAANQDHFKCYLDENLKEISLSSLQLPTHQYNFHDYAAKIAPQFVSNYG